MHRILIACLGPGLLVTFACAGADVAQLDLPLYELHEEWRIISNDSVPFARMSSISDASPLLPGDRLMSIDASEALIRIYSPEGKLLRAFGRKGDGPLEFRRPAVGGNVGDTIWIWDSMGRGYHFFDTTFAPIGQARAPSRGGAYIGPVAGQAILLHAGDTLWQYNYDNEPIKHFVMPVIHPDFRTNVVVGTATRRLISPFAPRMDYSRMPGGRRLLVVEPAEYWGGKPGQISIRWMLMPEGTLSERVIASLPPVRITAARRDSAIATEVARFKISDAAAVEYRSKARIPDYLPAFERVVLANEEMVWLSLHESDSTLLVLSTSGKPTMRVRLPKEGYLLAASGESVWAVAHDSSDVPMLVKYRLRRPD